MAQILSTTMGEEESPLSPSPARLPTQDSFASKRMSTSDWLRSSSGTQVTDRDLFPRHTQLQRPKTAAGTRPSQSWRTAHASYNQKGFLADRTNAFPLRLTRRTFNWSPKVLSWISAAGPKRPRPPPPVVDSPGADDRGRCNIAFVYLTPASTNVRACGSRARGQHIFFGPAKHSRHLMASRPGYISLLGRSCRKKSPPQPSKELSFSSPKSRQRTALNIVLPEASISQLDCRAGKRVRKKALSRGERARLNSRTRKVA